MRKLLAGALLASLTALPAFAQGTVAPLNGFWTARPIERNISGCDDELSSILHQMAAVMEQSAGTMEILWDERRFNVDSIRRAQHAENGSAWFQVADDLIVAIPRHRDATPAESPVKIWLRLLAADTFESHITLDVTTLRELEGRPIAPGTEHCRMQVTTIFQHDL